MAADRQYSFGRFRFDARTGELWRNRIEAKLTPRAAAVLHVLAEQAQQIVTKQDLFDQIWGGMAVSDDALTSCIQELRQALGDDARAPQYIETRHRRGYRLMVPVTTSLDRAGAASVRGRPVPESPTLVGRVAEMEELGRRFEQALAGRRQLVFVTGEPGIGKSALVGAFVEHIVARDPIRIAQGQCLDQHGFGEPYLPLIEALTRLAGATDGAAVKEILRVHAPSWLAQMPSLWTKSERSALEARGQATRERMLRELTQAMEEIATDLPLLLKLEDIHWSDTSTLNWLAHVARRPEPARLMVLATFRPADAAAMSTGLAGMTAELALHGHCHELSLDPLNLEAIATYLAARLGDAGRSSQAAEIAPLLLERTGGNPLFMVGIVNQLSRQPSAVATSDAIVSIPHDVRRFIERQIDELDTEDRDLLTAASVIRREFATAAVAAALELSDEQIEAICARLARHGVFIVKSGSVVWPDGTHAELYTFRHDLYRELLYDRLPATRRAVSHARVAHRLEAAWASRPDVIAAELAEHFERGHQVARAIPHHQRAAAKALRRSANEAAIRHLRQALDAIGHVENEGERVRIEVELRVAMGAAFIATRGFGAPEVLEAYAKAEELCDRLGDRADIFPALWGQWLFRFGRSEIEDARRLCARLLALAEKFGDPNLRLQAHHAMWPTAFLSGQLAETRAHAEAGMALYDAKVHQPLASSYGNHDACCCARNFAAVASALAGEEQHARALTDAALSVARSLDDPFSLALSLYFTSAVAQILGDLPLATSSSQLGMQTATEHGLAMPKAWSTAIAGWCAAESGDPDRGIEQLKEAIAALRATKSQSFMPYLLGLLADACAKTERHADALTAVEEAIAMAEATGEHFYSAELYRLHGDLCARSLVGRKREAGASFRTAIKIAKQQGAHALARKANESLRCWAG